MIEGHTGKNAACMMCHVAFISNNWSFPAISHSYMKWKEELHSPRCVRILSKDCIRVQLCMISSCLMQSVFSISGFSESHLWVCSSSTATVLSWLHCCFTFSVLCLRRAARPSSPFSCTMSSVVLGLPSSAESGLL